MGTWETRAADAGMRCVSKRVDGVGGMRSRAEKSRKELISKRDQMGVPMEM